jgi:hypothetical protein
MKNIVCKRPDLSPIPLAKVDDSDYGILWLSDEINYGDWPFRFAIRLQYADYWSQEWADQAGRYHVSILVVSPTAAQANIPDVARSLGIGLEQFNEASGEAQCSMLIDYGYAACLAQEQGNNLRQTLAKMKHLLPEVNFMFGFWMDKQLNAIGDTGWDWVAGNIGAKQFAR